MRVKSEIIQPGAVKQENSGNDQGSPPYEMFQTEKSRPKFEYLALMSGAVPHLNVAFSVHVLTRCTAIAFLKHVQQTVENFVLSPMQVFSLVRDFTFTKKRGEKKTVWHTPEGRSASVLKRSTMYCCLIMARRDVFGVFAQTPMLLPRKTAVSSPPSFDRTGCVSSSMTNTTSTRGTSTSP